MKTHSNSQRSVLKMRGLSVTHWPAQIMQNMTSIFINEGLNEKGIAAINKEMKRAKTNGRGGSHVGGAGGVGGNAARARRRRGGKGGSRREGAWTWPSSSSSGPPRGWPRPRPGPARRDPTRKCGSWAHDPHRDPPPSSFFPHGEWVGGGRGFWVSV